MVGAAPLVAAGVRREDRAVGARGRTLGRGRSAEVRLVRTETGPVAEKVFVGDWISNAVNRVLSGAPLPYRWCDAAVGAALERRAILERLMAYWFGGEVGIARGIGRRWDRERRALVLIADYVKGRPPRLRHPLRPQAPEEARLRERIMPALQQRLLESGFAGLVWQAGLGNPKALDNFLCDPATGRIAFVDQESGVPAIFAVSFRAWRVYLPLMWRLGHPPMDDVECGRLRRYLADHAAGLKTLHGAAAVAELAAHVDRLERYQDEWHGMKRRARRTAAAARLGPWRGGAPSGWWRGALAAARYGLKRLDPRGRAAAARSFVTSPGHRTRIGDAYVRGRILHWLRRGQLSRKEARALAAALRREREAGRYLTDFGAHLGLKATFFTAEVAVLGALSLLGVPLYLLGLIFVLDGPIYRTLYSLGRSAKNVLAGRPIVWVALGVGLVPFFGTLAFPAQMLWSASGRRDPVAQFVVYDSFSRLAANVPLVGGADTELEHRLNRVAHRLVA